MLANGTDQIGSAAYPCFSKPCPWAPTRLSSSTPVPLPGLSAGPAFRKTTLVSLVFVRML
jgi:hypothetical protein